jgi:Protein of unknown function (DUF2892)
MADRRNISEAERWGSLIGGVALTAYGLGRFRRHGWILATFGVLLFRRGLTRHCHTYDLLGVSTAPASSGEARVAPAEDPAVAPQKVLQMGFNSGMLTVADARLPPDHLR